MRKIYYLNTLTGEVTNSHGEAMAWFRQKTKVELRDENTDEVLTSWEW